ncbi:MAG: ThuA domain-containing protein [Acidobacteriaceae bacterium]|nr:ThuA domain-containing protein [Acidobacteriaceae bacterium]
MRTLFLLWSIIALSFLSPGEDLLIVADEIPAMQIVASDIQQHLGLTSKIIGQKDMAASLSNYKAVIVYIHHAIDTPAENAFIGYAENGGKLLLLHHTIGSPKRKNVRWFPFLGIELPTGELAEGGYKYYDPVSFDLVNLAPNHPITSKNVQYEETVEYSSPLTQGLRQLPGTRFNDTEIYLNHRLLGQRTILLGIKYKDPRGDEVFMQDTGGWMKETSKGLVIYFMPGHLPDDFKNRAYAQILVNAVAYHR